MSLSGKYSIETYTVDVKAAKGINIFCVGGENAPNVPNSYSTLLDNFTMVEILEPKNIE